MTTPKTALDIWNASRSWAEGQTMAILAGNVTGAGWTAFLQALGYAESTGTYGKKAKGNSFLGMYQIGSDLLTDLNFFHGLGGQLLSVGDQAAFLKNPLAQDLAAIMEFSGTPNWGGQFASKYTAVVAALNPNISISALLNQTFTINFIDGRAQATGSGLSLSHFSC